MPNDSVVEMGMTPNSWARILNEQRKFVTFDPENIRRAELMTQEVARALLAELKRQFEPHDRTGATMRSMRMTATPLGAQIRIGGAGALIERGTPPHPIFGNPILRFIGQDGAVVFRNMVNHPGTAPDPFVERAMTRVQVLPQLDRLYTGAYAHFRVEPRGV